jgi:hypothetical protein
MSALPAGNVPAASDGVPIAQTGTNVVVTYSQFLSGLPGAANVDGSELLITAAGSSVQQRLADFAASTLPRSGGTLTGWLGLAGDPSTALQAATKDYVDARMFRSGDTMTGPLILSADPTMALAATTKEYADARVSRSGDTMTGPLGLPTYTVAALPPSTVGALAYATNGRKTGEAAGAGTGVLVVGGSDTQWISVMSGTAVLA